MGCHGPIIVLQVEANWPIQGYVEASLWTTHKPHYSPRSLSASLLPLIPRCPRRRHDIVIAVGDLFPPSLRQDGVARSVALSRCGPRIAGQATVADAAAASGETERCCGGGRQFQAQPRTRLGADNPLARDSRSRSAMAAMASVVDAAAVRWDAATGHGRRGPRQR